MDIKLSICIPTYNRADLLAQTLENVIAQATDGVEIVVSDNASSDHTEQVVCGCRERFPRLTYFRQSENVGADRNYISAVSLARGEYCWLFGDDDLMAEGAISLLLNSYLSTSGGDAPPVEFVQLSVQAYDFTMTKALSRSAETLGVLEDVRTRDVLAYFVQFFRESFLSGFVVRRDRWSAVDPEKYIGTGLSYQGVVYEYLQPDSPVVFVARPLVKYRSGNPSWSASLLDIMVRQMARTLDALPARYDPVKAAARRGYEARLPVTMLLLAQLRAEGHYDIARYREYLRAYFAARPLSRTGAFLLAVAPPAALRAARAVQKKRRAKGLE